MIRAGYTQFLLHSVALAVCTVAFGLVPTVLCAQDAPAGASDDTTAEEPEFKTDGAKEAFGEARKLFDAGDYKKASRAFSKAKRGGKSRADKKLVDAWIVSCKSAPAVKKLEFLAEKKLRMEAYTQGEMLAQKCKGTPAEGVFRKFLDELGAQIFYPIENFDFPSSKFTEKYGKTFVKDPAIVFDGPMCLKWESTKDRKAGTLKLERVPRNWNEFDSVEFWVNVNLAPPEPQAVIVCPAEKGKKAQGNADAFISPIKLGGRTGEWQRVRLPLAKFKQHGRATLGNVADFRVQIRAGRQFDFYIDKVRLIRKNPGSDETTGKKKGRGGK